MVFGALPLLYGLVPLVEQDALPTKLTAGPLTAPAPVVELLPHALAAMVVTTARARRMRRTGSSLDEGNPGSVEGVIY